MGSKTWIKLLPLTSAASGGHESETIKNFKQSNRHALKETSVLHGFDKTLSFQKSFQNRSIFVFLEKNYKKIDCI